MASVEGSVMMTYDVAPEVRALAQKYGFRVELIAMKNTRHALIRKMVILKP
jgi:DNA adenine methylase